MRPDGPTHVTWNYFPSCTYVADRLGAVLCGNQDRWFASRSNVPARAGTTHRYSVDRFIEQLDVGDVIIDGLAATS
jgi:hypothetical protein